MINRATKPQAFLLDHVIEMFSTIERLKFFGSVQFITTLSVLISCQNTALGYRTNLFLTHVEKENFLPIEKVPQ